MSSDDRLKRLKYRSWHRGTREMDLLLGSFADTHLATFASGELDQYEALLQENDPDLYNWITRSKNVPTELDHGVMQKLLAHRFADKKAV